MLKNIIKNIRNYLTIKLFGKGALNVLLAQEHDNLFHNKNLIVNSKISALAKVKPAHKIHSCSIDDFTYVDKNSHISLTEIGKFCSIGPNFISGWGIHPTIGLSTSPMFYSTLKQNGISLSKNNKIKERKKIIIGNDVFIGMNVSILDGVMVGDGAVIAAGAVVTKSIPPYAIVGGVPAKIIKYRFDTQTIEALLNIEWWKWDSEELQEVEKYFWNISDFVEKYRRD